MNNSQSSYSQETPPNYKTCSSCMRDLPLNCFGILLTSKDGYNYHCKECKKFCQKKTYYSKKRTISEYRDPFIYFPPEGTPLMISNKILLDHMLKIGGVSTLSGISIDKKEAYKVKIQIEKDTQKIELYSDKEELILSMEYSSEPKFHKAIVYSWLKLLKSHRIKLGRVIS